MKFLILLLIFLTSCASVEWSRADKACGVFYLGGHTMDMVSTEDMLDRGHYEMNPILGKHPSDTEVMAYGIATTCIVLIVADQVGKYSTKLRKAILLVGGAAGYSLGIHNFGL